MLGLISCWSYLRRERDKLGCLLSGFLRGGLEEVAGESACLLELLFCFTLNGF